MCEFKFLFLFIFSNRTPSSIHNVFKDISIKSNLTPAFKKIAGTIGQIFKGNKKILSFFICPYFTKDRKILYKTTEALTSNNTTNLPHYLVRYKLGTITLH